MATQQGARIAKGARSVTDAVLATVDDTQTVATVISTSDLLVVWKPGAVTDKRTLLELLEAVKIRILDSKFQPS